MGKKLALQLAPFASAVILVGRTEEKLQNVAAEISTVSAVHYFTCDLANTTDVQATVQKIASHASCIDIVLNVAGGNFIGKTHNCPADVMEYMFNGYVRGLLLMNKLLIPLLRNSEGPRIVNFLIDWQRNGPGEECGNAVFTTTKEALRVFTGCLASEESNSDLKVSNIYLGEINDEDDPEESGMKTAELCEVIRSVLFMNTIHVKEITLCPVTKFHARESLHVDCIEYDL